MKNKLVLPLLVFLTALPLFALLSWTKTAKPVREFYQLTVYHFANQEQEKVLDKYFQTALIPALHKQGLTKVGVLKALANDTVKDKLIYVLLPVQSLEKMNKISSVLENDKDYQSAGAEYINAGYQNPPYSRMETIFMQAFSLAPVMQMPVLKAEKKERVYELRSYESATEKIYKNKVKMFNDGDEIGLFKRLGFNAVFYAEVISGSKMPNLMYMTSFENMADRDAHWQQFRVDAYWKELSAMPEYQHNVSHIDISFLRPADYSDF